MRFFDLFEGQHSSSVVMGMAVKVSCWTYDKRFHLLDIQLSEI